MSKRKFAGFTDAELEILGYALEEYGAPDLLKQVNKETREREYNRKRHEEWSNSTENILLLVL